MKSQYKVIGMDAAGHIVMHLRDNEGEIKLYATRTGAQNQANKFSHYSKPKTPRNFQSVRSKPATSYSGLILRGAREAPLFLFVDNFIFSCYLK